MVLRVLQFSQNNIQMYYHGLCMECKVQHKFKELENKYVHQIFKQPQKTYGQSYRNIHDSGENVFNNSIHSIVQQ